MDPRRADPDPGASWDDDPVWAAARARTREEVRAAFAPRPSVCRQCGHSALAAARVCPACGCAYAETREPGMTRRAKRRLAIGCAAVTALLVLLGILIVPNVQRTSREAKTRAAAETERIVAATRHRIAVDQRLRTAPLPPRHRSKQGLVAALEAAVTLDARRRVAAGSLQGPILRTNCSPWAPAPRNGSTLSFSCTAVNVVVRRGSGQAVGELGYPFWAKVDVARRRLYWCKVNPKPGEQSVNEGQLTVQLDRRCNLKE